MRSREPSDRRWSLTRRLSWRFAIVAALVLALYASLNGYFLLDELREDFKDFMEHELAEVKSGIKNAPPTDEGIARVVLTATEAASEPMYALRVRRDDGPIVAEGGAPDLLKRVPEPLRAGPSWREFLLSRGVTVATERLENRGVTIEMIVASDRLTAEMRRFLTFAALSFLAAVAIAAFAGWMTAQHSLRALREVVARAEQICSPEHALPIRLDDAPDEIRDVGNALNRMLDRVRVALHQLQTFTAGLAHELRSPLQNLLGETEVALLADRSPDQYRHLLKSHLEDLTELSDAVDNLIAWCRSHEPRAGDLEAFDLATEAKLRLPRERRSAERLGITLRFESRGDTRLLADREGCLRVLRNLVGNALVWTEPESTVTVTLEGLADRVRLTVDDQGPGVDPMLADRIFDPFVSGAAKSGKRGSYGLGLAICKSIVDEHGGVLRFETRPEGGARFIAEFAKSPRLQHTSADASTARA